MPKRKPLEPVSDVVALDVYASELRKHTSSEHGGTSSSGGSARASLAADYVRRFLTIWLLGM
jgi:hypothetical protein